jgi:hypothetical protein
LWKIEIDNQDFHSDYKDLRFVLSSGEIKDFPTVNLMVDNLTYRLEKWLTRKGVISDEVLDKLPSLEITKMIYDNVVTVDA